MTHRMESQKEKVMVSGWGWPQSFCLALVGRRTTRRLGRMVEAWAAENGRVGTAHQGSTAHDSRPAFRDAGQQVQESRRACWPAFRVGDWWMNAG